MDHSPRPLGVAALLFSITPTASWGCATCGCTVNSDAAMGYSTTVGWRVNLEYTYIDQDELRGGTGNATPEQVVNNPSNPSLGGGEIERDTVNRYITLGLSFRPTADWNFNLLVPYVERDHTTYGEQQLPYTPSESAPDQISGAHVSNLGDVKLIANYQGILALHNLGLQLGIKLPTGQYGNAVNFFDGPNVGTPLDTSLQAGTGSTDIILGAYYHQPVSLNFDAFVNGQFQSAIWHRLDQPGNDYRPGNIDTMGFGVRYLANPQLIPQLQINLSHKSPDQGALADTTDTAGTVAYLSPGMTVQIIHTLHIYGVVQVPIYSNLNGYQLFPHWTATAGLSYAF